VVANLVLPKDKQIAGAAEAAPVAEQPETTEQPER
jgi:hypothetical protein